MKTIVMDAFGREDGPGKTIDDFKTEPLWNCRFHATNYWHEVGCPHREWTTQELRDALVTAKQSSAWQLHLLNFPKDIVAMPRKESN